MSDSEKNIEDLEEEIQTEDSEDDDASANGEVLYNLLRLKGLVDDPWEDLSASEKGKYQEVSDELM